jgi:hypothetical protein
MPLPTRIQLALEKVLRALAKLQTYARSGANKPKQQIRLEQAVEVAIDRFIVQFPAPAV